MKQMIASILFLFLFVHTFGQETLPCWMNNCTETVQPKPLKVYVSGVINKVADLDIDAQTLKMDFFLWMRWDNCTVDADGNPWYPYQTVHLTNLVDRWGLTEIVDYEQGNCELVPGYAYYFLRYEGNFQQKFEFSAYPLDEHELFITLEEEFSESTDLELIADPYEPFSYGFDFRVPGWDIVQTLHYAENQMYRNTYGVITLNGTQKYSRIYMGLHIKRPATVYTFKILPPILITLSVCLGTFLMEIDLYDTRVATAVGGLAAEIFLQLSFSERLPRAIDYLTFMDHIFNLCYFILLIVILENIVVRHYFRKVVRYEAKREKYVDSDIREKTKRVLSDSGELAVEGSVDDERLGMMQLDIVLLRKIEHCKNLMRKIDRITFIGCCITITTVLVALSGAYAVGRQ